MAHKDNLRKQRNGTVINNTFEKDEQKHPILITKGEII